MAQSINFVGGFTPQVGANGNLSGNQYNWVQVHAAGVTVADIRSCVNGAAFLLQNKPTSGQAVTLWGSPNISKAVAGEAITAGTYVQPMSASGLSGASATTSGFVTGWALTGAAGSGAVFDCRVLR